MVCPHAFSAWTYYSCVEPYYLQMYIYVYTCIYIHVPPNHDSYHDQLWYHFNSLFLYICITCSTLSNGPVQCNFSLFFVHCKFPYPTYCMLYVLCIYMWAYVVIIYLHNSCTCTCICYYSKYSAYVHVRIIYMYMHVHVHVLKWRVVFLIR